MVTQHCTNMGLCHQALTWIHTSGFPQRARVPTVPAARPHSSGLSPQCEGRCPGARRLGSGPAWAPPASLAPGAQAALPPSRRALRPPLPRAVV